jgi:ribosomal protein S18 acetylase RimI-like enzyme
VITIRPARLDDEPALQVIDQDTWTSLVSPAPTPPVGRPFFSDHTRVPDVFVAEVDGRVVGYAKVGQDIGLASHAQVLELAGLAVSPTAQGNGVGRKLVDESIAEARRRGARKLSLRVLAPNTGARRLYESAGFVVEGTLIGEFLLDGKLVDDVLMAVYLE